jgi:predicted NAD/FAD-binding protein
METIAMRIDKVAMYEANVRAGGGDSTLVVHQVGMLCHF